MGVTPKRVYVDQDMTGTNRDRTGLRQALAATRAGDTLVVTKLDRLARSIRDARDIVDELTASEVKLQRSVPTVHDPHDPVGRLLFNVLAMVAELEADLIRTRTREDMAVARAKGKPKLSIAQEKHLLILHGAGEHTSTEIAELFGVSRATVYRAIERASKTK
jgi:DNA invertase Pin-like site-specific DNA recombinase